ncbi:hypothetical protein MTP99_016080 [Tenebrio molitor]|nr:hypothetical protein MTP99_016080 [Tenebrio molitor]
MPRELLGNRLLLPRRKWRKCFTNLHIKGGRRGANADRCGCVIGATGRGRRIRGGEGVEAASTCGIQAAPATNRFFTT